MYYTYNPTSRTEPNHHLSGNQVSRNWSIWISDLNDF